MSAVPPVCPRCRSNINVRRRPWTNGWTCSWCLFQAWKADLEEQLRRLHQELDRITRRAA
jgi:ribosomal protein L37AE/L43A